MSAHITWSIHTYVQITTKLTEQFHGTTKPATHADISPTPNRPNVQDRQDALGKQDAREWVCPGVSVRKRWLTGIGVAMASAVFFFIALWEGASMLVSTLIGIVFIGGFIGYLRSSLHALHDSARLRRRHPERAQR